MKPRLTATLLTLLAVMLSCSDKGTQPAGVESAVWQIPGCVSHGMAKATSGDSCFVYAFGEQLDLMWCLPANCCPDSQRFVSSARVTSDTISVTVVDTARNLCRCICNYQVRAQFAYLPNNRYLFLVRYADSSYYKETITRSP